MKKTAFLLLVVTIFSACAAPQVTVTSEVTVTLTPTPIPTSHPEFAALQQVISDSGLRFTLQADGLIYDGAEPIPGLTVAPDGTMTLTVDGESVTLDPAGVTFDDEKGISIDGYEWDADANDGAGAWVEAVSPAMQQTNALIEQYSIDPETVTVTEEGGAVNVTDNETGTVLIRTIGENSKFDLGFAVDTIAAKSCEPKPEFVPSSSGRLLAQSSPAANVYFTDLKNELGMELNENMWLLRVLIDREQRCWGQIVDGSDLVYRDSESIPQQIPLIDLTEAEAEAIAFDR